jgi:hypothetical protein
MDSQVADFMELSRSASALAIALGRIAAGNSQTVDTDSVRRAADSMNQLIGTSALSLQAHCPPPFTPARGLDVMLGIQDSHQLRASAATLAALAGCLAQSVLDDEAKKLASICSQLFFQVRQHALERAAIASEGGTVFRFSAA